MCTCRNKLTNLHKPFYLRFADAIKPNEMKMECCGKIDLKSSLYDKQIFKTLGVYNLQPLDVIENHNVYKHETSNRHVAFSTNHGWTIYQNKPDDTDPPLVSFTDCKPPELSDCPTRCINNGTWKYFHQNARTDENNTLTLDCFEDSFHINKMAISVIIGPAVLSVIILSIALILYRKKIRPCVLRISSKIHASSNKDEHDDESAEEGNSKVAGCPKFRVDQSPDIRRVEEKVDNTKLQVAAVDQIVESVNHSYPTSPPDSPTITVDMSPDISRIEEKVDDTKLQVAPVDQAVESINYPYPTSPPNIPQTKQTELDMTTKLAEIFPMLQILDKLKINVLTDPDNITLPNNTTTVSVDVDPALPNEYVYIYNWNISFRIINSGSMEEEKYSRFLEDKTEDPCITIANLKAGEYKIDISINVKEHPEIPPENLKAVGWFTVFPEPSVDIQDTRSKDGSLEAM